MTHRSMIHTVARYPNHEASKRLEASEDHREELEKLRSPDGDYFHGFHSGVLAAAKMFQEHADILHVNEHDVRWQMEYYGVIFVFLANMSVWRCNFLFLSV